MDVVYEFSIKKFDYSRKKITFAPQNLTDMPKMKTNSSAKKRFKVTGTGKIKRSKAYKNHILTKKSKVRKKRLSQPGLVNETEMRRVKGMLCI